MLKKLHIPLLLLAIVQYMFSSEVLVIFGLLLLSYEVVLDKGKIINKPIYGFNILILFLFWGIGLGLINYERNNIVFRDYIRDIFYYISPVIFIYIGAYYNRRGVNKDTLFNTIILWGTIKAFIILISTFQKIGALNSVSYVYNWRNEVGNGDYYSTIAMVLLLTPNIIEKKFPKWLNNTSLVVCSIVFVITFSRTNILIFACLLTCINWDKIKKSSYIKELPKTIFMVLICLACLYLIVPNTVINNFTDKLLASFTEIGQQSDWTRVSDIQKNWRGYETFSAIQEYKNFDIISQLFGRGFGKKIYVGSYAYSLLKQVNGDGSAATTIPVLHNGYATHLIKLGAIGVLLYVLFYLTQIQLSCREKKRLRSNDYLCSLYLGISITLLLVTYFLNGLYKDGCPFLPLIILLGYIGNKVKNGEKNVR